MVLKWLVALLLLSNRANFAQLPRYSFDVKVTVDAPQEQEALIESAIYRELRKSPDVRIVTNKERLGIGVMCLAPRKANGVVIEGLVCGFVFTLEGAVGSPKEAVSPTDGRGCETLLQMAHSLLYYNVMTAAVDHTDWVASQIVAIFNTSVLEPGRQAQEKK